MSAVFVNVTKATINKPKQAESCFFHICRPLWRFLLWSPWLDRKTLWHLPNWFCIPRSYSGPHLWNPRWYPPCISEQMSSTQSTGISGQCAWSTYPCYKMKLVYVLDVHAKITNPFAQKRRSLGPGRTAVLSLLWDTRRGGLHLPQFHLSYLALVYHCILSLLQLTCPSCPSTHLCPSLGQGEAHKQRDMSQNIQKLLFWASSDALIISISSTTSLMIYNPS